jgi:hypothetical protein
MRRMGVYREAPPCNSKYVAKPYEKMQYPGQRVQIDVKFVPKACCNNLYGEEYFQFTAIDEYSRERFLYGFKDNSGYSAAQFLVKAAEYFRYRIECAQTDNGQEFTNKFTSKKTHADKVSRSRAGVRHTTQNDKAFYSTA